MKGIFSKKGQCKGTYSEEKQLELSGLDNTDNLKRDKSGFASEEPFFITFISDLITLFILSTIFFLICLFIFRRITYSLL